LADLAFFGGLGIAQDPRISAILDQDGLRLRPLLLTTHFVGGLGALFALVVINSANQVVFRRVRARHRMNETEQAGASVSGERKVMANTRADR
jgi:hypothetical protein